MQLTGELEQDILDIFRAEGSPLTVLEIWDGLNDKGIQVPVLYLNKVLKAMVEFTLLEKAGKRLGLPLYRPAGIRMGGNGLKRLWQQITGKIAGEESTCS